MYDGVSRNEIKTKVKEREERKENRGPGLLQNEILNSKKNK